MCDLPLPYRAEYSKSSRANCKVCNHNIAKDTLRLAVMIQSHRFDGMLPRWYHYSCFFEKQRPKSIADIAHFDSLRWDDQQKISNKVAELSGGIEMVIEGEMVKGKSKGKSKKRSATITSIAAAKKGDFGIEYSKSSRALCRGCEERINKGEIRISKKDFESAEALRIGSLDMWYHPDCFVKLRDELGFHESANVMAGFRLLTKEDKDEISNKLPEKEPRKSEAKEEPHEKVAKTENNIADMSTMHKQNDEMFHCRDMLKKNLNKKQMIELLKFNQQEIPHGEEAILDRLSDVMTFGVVTPCTKCHGGQYVFRTGVGYQCHGDVVTTTKCMNVETDPERKDFAVPKNLKKQFSFLERYKSHPTKREVVVKHPTSATVTSLFPAVPVMAETPPLGPHILRHPPPLKNMEVVIVGKTKRSKAELKAEVMKLGGKVVRKIHDNLSFVIASPEEVASMSEHIKQAKEANVQVVSEDILDEIEETEPYHMIQKKNICDWGSDPKSRVIVVEPEKRVGRLKRRVLVKAVPPAKVEQQLKEGNAVDPDSGLDQEAHIYERDGEYYNAVLALVDPIANKNSFYKVQLLESNEGMEYWIFRSWGRVGTNIGDNTLDKMGNLDDAMKEFTDHYYDKTGNLWENRHKFVKHPEKMYPLNEDMKIEAGEAA